MIHNFLNGTRVGWDHRERKKATSHWGDIRSPVGEQSYPAREQSPSLELRYYRLVGPSVWTCTCCKAGLCLRRDSGGGRRLSAVIFCFFLKVFTRTYLLFLFLPALLKHTSLSPCLSYPHFTSSLFASSYLLFPFSCSLLTTIIMLCPPPSSYIIHSILQMLVGSKIIRRGSWWPATPALCGLFRLLFLGLLLLGSCRLNHQQTLFCSGSIVGETLETWVHVCFQESLTNRSELNSSLAYKTLSYAS